MSNRGSVAKELEEHWTLVCSQHGTNYSLSDQEKLLFYVLIQTGFDLNQIKWGIKLYMGQTAYPSAADFISWLDGVKDHLPDRLVAGAYLTGKPLLIKMGDDLETLRAAYFPSLDVEFQIKSLEARLETALV